MSRRRSRRLDPGGLGLEAAPEPPSAFGALTVEPLHLLSCWPLARNSAEGCCREKPLAARVGHCSPGS